MNVSLRQAILNERRRRLDAESTEQAAVHFLQEFRCLSQTDIKSFAGVYDYVVLEQEHFLAKKEKLSGHISDLQLEIEKLEHEVEVRDEQLRAGDERDHKHSEIVRQLRSKLNLAASQVETLKVETASQNELIEKQSAAIRKQKSAFVERIEDSNREVRELQEKLEKKQEESLKAQEDERKKSSVKREIIKRNFDLELSNAKKAYDEQLRKLKREIKQTRSESQQKNHEINELKNEISALIESISELKECLKSRDDQIHSLEKKTSYLETQVQESSHRCDGLLRVKDDLEGKIRQLMEEVTAANAKVEQSKRQLHSKVNAMKAQNRSELEKAIAEAGSEVGVKHNEVLALKDELAKANEKYDDLFERIKRAECKWKRGIRMCEDLRNENERLRNLMREKSDGQNVTVGADLKRLKDLLRLPPEVENGKVVDEVAGLVGRKRCIRGHSKGKRGRISSDEMSD
jgi:chromosome segregation ATPase